MAQTDSSPQRMILPPDGRQTRIDFFKQGDTRKASGDWWQNFSNWFKSAHQEADPNLAFYNQQLEKEGYSEKSRRSYLFMMKRFFDHVKEKDPGKISLAEIEDYNFEFFVSGRYSRSYQLQFINAIKLYFQLTLGIDLHLKHLRKTGTGRKSG